MCGALLLAPNARGGDVSFVEDFARERPNTALKHLIPGTEDYYYYNCPLPPHRTVRQGRGFTRPWHERHSQTARLTEIQTRHALLTYREGSGEGARIRPQPARAAVRSQKETLGSIPNLPIALDQSLISRARLKASSLSRWGNLDNFEDVALDYMASEKLSWEQRRNLIGRLQRPDIAELPRLVVDDLNSPHSGEFGGFAIHKQMTLAQLDEVLKLKANVLNQSAFVSTYITKPQPEMKTGNATASSRWRISSGFRSSSIASTGSQPAWRMFSSIVSHSTGRKANTIAALPGIRPTSAFPALHVQSMERARRVGPASGSP